MNLNFFLVENTVNFQSRLYSQLNTAYPDSNIFPNKGEIYNDWMQVTDDIKKNTSNNDTWIFILDLAIESENMASVKAGVEHAYGLKLLRPNGIFIAFTQWPEYAENEPHFADSFDSCIDKQRWMSFDTKDEKTYVRQIISTMLREKLDIKPPYILKDSMGLRLSEAAFTNKIFDFLVEEVSHGWKDIEIESLTSGHSGAFLFAFTGIHSGGRKRIVIKCARDEEILKNEIHCVDEHLAELGPLNEVLPQFEHRLHMCPLSRNNRVYFYLQAEVLGETLLGMLSNTNWNEKIKNILDGIIELEMRCYSIKNQQNFSTIYAKNIFPLSPIDCRRAEQSLLFLKEIGSTIKKGSQWPTSLPEPIEISNNVSKLINNWNTLLTEEGQLLSVGQHGDLNPGNIIIPKEGKVVLIDLSRLGLWSVGYDISRLATLLRIRLIDKEGSQDWVINRLNTWIEEKFCSIDTKNMPENSLCPPSAYCDQSIQDVFLKYSDDIQVKLKRGYKIGTIWDLIKILSYVDLSPFKRLWALIACWQLSLDLGLF